MVQLSLGAKLSKNSRMGASSEVRVSCFLLVTFTRLEILLVSFPGSAVSRPPLWMSSLLSALSWAPLSSPGSLPLPPVPCSPSFSEWRRSPRGESPWAPAGLPPQPRPLHSACPWPVGGVFLAGHCVWSSKEPPAATHSRWVLSNSSESSLSVGNFESVDLWLVSPFFSFYF